MKSPRTPGSATTLTPSSLASPSGMLDSAAALGSTLKKPDSSPTRSDEQKDASPPLNIMGALRAASAMKKKMAERRGKSPSPAPAAARVPKKKATPHENRQHTKSDLKKMMKHLDEADDDDRDVDNIVHFCFWAKDVFKVLYELFRFPDRTGKYMKCRPVPVDEFVDYVYRYGYTGDAVAICKEIKRCAPSEKQNVYSEHYGDPNYDITMPMLQRFIKRSEKYTGGMEWSPLNEFRKELLERRGSYLRAWRLDVDLNTTGSVPFMTFIAACHKMLHGWQCQAIWHSYRPDGSHAPLEFCEFAPEEAANLDKFVQVLWVACGFNLNKAWEEIDIMERLWVQEKEFIEGLERLGFQGNGRLIFRGLDTYGLGRLWRRELDYIKILASAQTRTPHGVPQIRVLSAWVNHVFGGSDGFLEHLGLDGAADDDPGGPTIPAREFAQQLQDLNYPDDAHICAYLAARSAGPGNDISRLLIQKLVEGQRPTFCCASNVQNPSRSSSRPTTPRKENKSEDAKEKGWNNRLDDICVKNEDKPVYMRKFFNHYKRSAEMTDEELETPRPIRRSASTPPIKRLERPDWDSNVDITSNKSLNLTTLKKSEQEDSKSGKLKKNKDSARSESPRPRRDARSESPKPSKSSDRSASKESRIEGKSELGSSSPRESGKKDKKEKKADKEDKKSDKKDKKEKKVLRGDSLDMGDEPSF